MRLPICNLLVAAVVTLAGCRAPATSSSATPHRTEATTQPILYHRTGGIAATDDRVIIWPDGVVQVTGKILPGGETRIASDVHERLHQSLNGWNRLGDIYLAPGAADAYTIVISYGGKTIEASDLAPNLPEQFRRVYTEIEAIAGQAQSPEPKPAP